MNNTIVTLKKGEGRTIKAGGAWIYDNEIESITGSFKNGEIVSVHDFDGYPMGKGFINQNSKIRIRMMTRKAEQEVDEEFLRERIKRAWDYRKSVVKSSEDLNAIRVIFGEADFLPGFVVDKYADVLVVECLALGMELLKKEILTYLIAIMGADGFSVRAVFERSDAPVRKKEGLFPYKGLLYLDGKWLSDLSDVEAEQIQNDFEPKVEIIKNGVHYVVDVKNGQKTGFFLDQKYNRLAMQNLCNKLVDCDENIGGRGTLKALDCFTHMGTFALNMGLGGATDVTGLDISEFAVQQATENAELNGLSDRVRFRAANVLDELPKLVSEGELYDVVVVDPPAFTKSREATKNAIKGYREVNMKGLKLVRDGGYYATCSCSHFMTEELLKKTVKEAAKAVHKRLRQVEFKTQAPDHPILWAADESYYLKFMIFQICEEK